MDFDDIDYYGDNLNDDEVIFKIPEPLRTHVENASGKKEIFLFFKRYVISHFL